MKLLTRLNLVLLSLLLFCSLHLNSQIQNSETRQEIYHALTGFYELSLNSNTLRFNITYEVNESKLYFQAISSHSPTSPPASEMLPADNEILTFITKDPNGQKIEIRFDESETSKILVCQVSVVDRGWKGKAVKLSETPKATSIPIKQDDTALSGSPDEQISQRIKQLFDQNLIAGGEILILNDRQVLLHEVHGWSDKEEEIPLRKNSIYRVRSMSKPFTATAIFILIEEGKLKLDDLVFQYLSSFNNKKSRQITVKQLLTHRSGFRQEEMPEGYWEKRSLRNAVNLLGEYGPPELPGKNFIYSDMNTAILGALVHEITGKPVEVFIQEHILDPLNMKNTYMNFSPNCAWSTQMNSTYEYSYSDNSTTKYWDNTQYQSVPFFRASGGLYTSVSDYAIFLQTWMDKGLFGDKRILNSETILNAIQKYDGLGRSRGYGMHWEIFGDSENPEILPPFGHGGSDGTVAIAIPSKNIVILFFTQTRGTPAIDRDFMSLIRKLYF